MFLQTRHGIIFINKAQAMASQEGYSPFTMKNDVLYRMGQDNRLKRCLSTIKTQKVMKELHKGTT
jgi:hypothetical protein